MGLFYEQVPAGGPTTRDVVADALRTNPNDVRDVAVEAEARRRDRAGRVREVQRGPLRRRRRPLGGHGRRAIATQAADLGKSSDALWAAAAIVFGVVVGFLAGEKSAA